MPLEDFHCSKNSAAFLGETRKGRPFSRKDLSPLSLLLLDPVDRVLVRVLVLVLKLLLVNARVLFSAAAAAAVRSSLRSSLLIGEELFEKEENKLKLDFARCCCCFHSCPSCGVEIDERSVEGGIAESAPLLAFNSDDDNIEEEGCLFLSAARTIRIDEREDDERNLFDAVLASSIVLRLPIVLKLQVASE
jgi:uncharacterized protein (UPF0212 family)